MTASSGPCAPIQPSAFLDSNILVGLFLFWDACRAARVGPQTVSEWDALKAALESAGVNMQSSNREDGEFLRQGIASFHNLSAAADTYHLFTSQVCWSEAHHVLLEARGLEHLVRQGVPFSLRVKRPQVLYRSRLGQDDYDQLNADFDEFRESLRVDHQLDLIDVEDSSTGFEVPVADIWDGAREVWSHVLMAVIDAYIYAAAIKIGADVFITSDGNLIGAVERLRDPQGDWIPLAASLKTALGLEQSAPLPTAQRPRQALPRTDTTLA